MTGPAPVDGSLYGVLDVCFDDYLGLGRRSFVGVDAVTFHGESGSGKSTAIDFLLARHPAFAGSLAEDVVIFDDLVSPHELSAVREELERGHRVIAGCHFGPRAVMALRPRWRVVSFAVDTVPEKIETWLARRGIEFSREAVEAFCHHFGANYTDAEILLERAPGESFDAALERYLETCERAAP